MSALSPELLREARGWIGDCTWADLEPGEELELAPAVVERGLARHYAGGLEAFREDCRELER